MSLRRSPNKTMPPTPAMTMPMIVPMTVPMMFAAMAATPFRRRFPRGAGEVPVLVGGPSPWSHNSSKQRSKKKPRRTDSVRLSREISFKTVQYRINLNVDESSAVESNYFASEEVSERSRTGGEYAR
jgi:hypothetical protein